MSKTIKQKMKPAFLIGLAGFVILFLFRFMYGYTTGMSEVREEYFSDFFSETQLSTKNYASDSYKIRKADYAVTDARAGNQHQVKEFDVNQKYEKTASIKSSTSDFDKQEVVIRKTVKDFGSIIQFEQNSGSKGNRALHLSIGVPPEKFDSFYVAALKIGKIKSKEVTKIDKTNEFKTLNAKKASLEKTRESLLDIKKQSGKIDEYINLQNRILDIEQELQNLGVALGDFDEENEFCTVKFSLYESYEVSISMLHRLKVAFEWTVQYYLLFLGISALCLVCAFFVLFFIDKLIPSIINKVN
jgi:hypothetical protein